MKRRHFRAGALELHHMCGSGPLERGSGSSAVVERSILRLQERPEQRVGCGDDVAKMWSRCGDGVSILAAECSGCSQYDEANLSLV